MKPICTSHLLILTALLTVAFTIPIMAEEKPASFSSVEESLGSMVIGDVPGFMSGVSGLVDQVMPGMGAMIPAQVGSLVGDPALSGFGDAGGMAALVFPGELKVVFAEVAESQRDSYREKAKEKGISSAVVGDLMIFSEIEAGIEPGKKVADEVYETYLKEKGDPNLRVTIQVPNVLETYKDKIEGGRCKNTRGGDSGFIQYPITVGSCQNRILSWERRNFLRAFAGSQGRHELLKTARRIETQRCEKLDPDGPIRWRRSRRGQL